MSLNPKISEWSSKIVWIVGASTGIGAALALALAEKNTTVIISSRSIDKLNAVQKNSEHPLHIYPLNIQNISEWASVYDNIIQKFGRIDHIILSAADYEAVRASTLSSDKITHIMNINLLGTLYGVNQILPDFLARESGAISIIASVAGYSGLPKALLYGPTKAALINFCESLYLDVNSKNIAVHLINPGFVKTPLTANNDFKMPALITPEEAAQEIINGFEKGQFEIHFPKRFTRFLKFIRILPYSLQLRLLKGIRK